MKMLLYYVLNFLQLYKEKGFFVNGEKGFY